MNLLGLVANRSVHKDLIVLGSQQVANVFICTMQGETGDENDEAHSECVSRLIAEEVAASLRSLIAKKAEVTLQ